MSAGSTPGPWSVNGDCVVAGANGNDIVAEAHGETQRELDANVNLIAAAPDLYAALNLLRDEMSVVDSWWSDLNNAVDKADDALAKARGEA